MRIVTDSAADLLPEEATALGITQAPLYIRLPDKEITSADIGHDDFYSLLERMFPVIPTTSQPSAGQFTELYNQIASQDKDILSIHISSGLSGTLGSAHVASGQVNSGSTVATFDTMTLSGGERFAVLAAARAARAGWSLRDILTRLEKMREQTEVVFTLETLEYLARGGRIGRVSALAGSLLKLKPIIRVDHADGKYSTISKPRTIAHALEHIARHLVQLYGVRPVWVSVMHGRMPAEAALLAEMLAERLNAGKMEVLRVSPVLGVHTGPGVVGAAVLPLELMEGLPAGA